MLSAARAWQRAGQQVPDDVRGQWDAILTERGIRDLLGGVLDAAEISPPWLLTSIFGPRHQHVGRYSEYGILRGRQRRQLIGYVGDVLVPSLPLPAPRWAPPPLSWLLFHPTTILRRHARPADERAFADEAWVFINGIMTDATIAQLNAAYLVRLFRRPITIIQNSTDGLVADLLECAAAKAAWRNGEAATKALPEIYRQLRDPQIERVVVIAHSQGTIIASVVLAALTGLNRFDTTGTGPLDLARFDPPAEAELAKLELYCLANCATTMRQQAVGRRVPFIESYGNEFDIVARLGVLAPHPVERDVQIDGPRFIRDGAWGHLLNQHYLDAIAAAQYDHGRPGPRQPGAVPFALLNGDTYPAAEPRLYQYLDGGKPPPL